MSLLLTSLSLSITSHFLYTGYSLLTCLFSIIIIWLFVWFFLMVAAETPVQALLTSLVWNNLNFLINENCKLLTIQHWFFCFFQILFCQGIRLCSLWRVGKEQADINSDYAVETVLFLCGFLFVCLFLEEGEVVVVVTFVWVFCLFVFLVLNKTQTSDLPSYEDGFLALSLCLMEIQRCCPPGAGGQWSVDLSFSTSILARLMLVKTWNGISDEMQWFCLLFLEITVGIRNERNFLGCLVSMENSIPKL